MNFKRRLLPAVSASAAVVLVFSSTVSFASGEANASQTAFEETIDHLYWDLLSYSPADLHFLQNSTEEIPISMENPLGSFVEETEEQKQLLTDAKASLESITRKDLTSHQRQVYLSLRDYIDDTLTLLDLPDYSSTLGASTGLLSGADTYFSEYYLLSEEDVSRYISLLQDIPRFLGEIEKELDYQESIGYTPSSYTFETLLERKDDLTDPEEHPYLEAFVSNIQEAGLSDQTVSSYTEQVTSILSDTVIPAYESFFDYIEEKSKTASESRGLCKYDQGKEYYAAMARIYTGTDMTPEEMMTYLQKKVAADLGSMSRILIMDESVMDRMDSITVPSNDPDEILSVLRENTLKLFPEIENLDYQISYLPEALEIDNVVAYYLTPPYDLTGRNIIRVNQNATDGDDALLWTTLAHEGFPGHLYQTQYYMQNSFQYPIERLLSSTGTSEGWALYTERLSLDWAGVDSSLADVYSYNSSIGMAIMSICDIGINYMDWSLSDLCDFLVTYYGEIEQEDAQEIYDSLVSDPAIYLAYGVGYYQICDLFDSISSNYSSEQSMYTAFLKKSSLSFRLLNKYLVSDGSI